MYIFQTLPRNFFCTRKRNLPPQSPGPIKQDLPHIRGSNSKHPLSTDKTIIKITKTIRNSPRRKFLIQLKSHQLSPSQVFIPSKNPFCSHMESILPEATKNQKKKKHHPLVKKKKKK